MTSACKKLWIFSRWTPFMLLNMKLIAYAILFFKEYLLKIWFKISPFPYMYVLYYICWVERKNSEPSHKIQQMQGEKKQEIHYIHSSPAWYFHKYNFLLPSNFQRVIISFISMFNNIWRTKLLYTLRKSSMYGVFVYV